MHHYTERVTHPQHPTSGHFSRGGSARRGSGARRLRGARSRGLFAPPGAICPSAEEEAAGERASPPLQGWLIGGDSARTARLSAVQTRDLRGESGRPQGPSRPTFPDSLGSMALLSVARADPATASRPPPPPAARPEEAAAATALDTGAPGGEGSPAGRERAPLPRLGAVAL